MDINLTTPAVLFPAISLLLLAYTNRFLALASVIRKLQRRLQKAAPDFRGIRHQIENLLWRIRLVRNMQFCGVLSLLLCTVCMFLLFLGFITAGGDGSSPCQPGRDDGVADLFPSSKSKVPSVRLIFICRILSAPTAPPDRPGIGKAAHFSWDVLLLNV